MLQESDFDASVDTIEERTVTLGDGSKRVLHFKHLPNTAFERYALWRGSDDEEVVASAAQRLVVLGVCDPDGKQALTLEQAVRLKRNVLQALFMTVLEVNGYSKKADDLGNG